MIWTGLSAEVAQGSEETGLTGISHTDLLLNCVLLGFPEMQPPNCTSGDTSFQRGEVRIKILKDRRYSCSVLGMKST